MHLFLRILANCAAIIIANSYLSGFIFTGSALDLFISGLVISIINALVKPIITLIALPVVLLTLGLFNIFINIGLLLIADRFLTQLSIQNFASAFWAVIIFSLTNSIFSYLNKSTVK